MSFAGNLLWFVFGGGLVAWLLWVLMGIVFALTIIGIPFAKASFRIARFAAFPFGKELIDGRLVGDKRITGTGFINFLWVILAGIWLSITHVLAGVLYCATVVGIPWGLAHFKLAKVSYAPLGKKTVTREMAAAAKTRAANQELNQKLGTE